MAAGTIGKKITAGRIGPPVSGTAKNKPVSAPAPGQIHTSMSSSDSSALASMNKIRAQHGLVPQTQIGVKAPSRSSSTGPTTVDTKTNSVKDAQGNVLATGSSLSEALAKQTQLSTGSAPSVAGRPDLYAVAPGKNQEVKPYYDASTKTTVTPATATSAQLGQAASGTLQSYNASQNLTYLDGKTFKDLQPVLSEADLIRGPNGQVWLKQGLSVDQVASRKATAVAGTGGATGDTLATDFKVDVPDTISTDTISALTETPVTETDFNQMMAQMQAKQDELLGLMAPGADELATKAQINDIKAQVEKSLTELSMGLNNVEDQPIAMQFITGQQASIQRSADAKLQNLARIETNLLNELGLEQDARKVKASVAQTQLGYLQTNLDTAFKVKQLVQQEEDSVFNRAMALKKDSQSTLGTILDSMKGIDESDMTPDQQKQLQDLAISSGIPYSLITAGLSNIKHQMMQDVTRKASGGGGGGSVPAIVIPDTPKGPSFEEYLAQKENEAGQSFTQARRDELRKEYDASQQKEKASVQNFADQFESVVINLGSVSSQTQARKYFQGLMSANDTAGMDSYLNRLALEGLTGKSKTDYDAMGTLSSGTSGALASIDAFSATNPGVYKTAIESGKPFVNASKDQKWVDFTSKVESAQAGYINAVYGANLTGGELERANRYVIDFNTDDIRTIKTKLTNMKNLGNDVRSRLLGEQRGNFSGTSDQTPEKPSLDSFVTNLDQYLR